MLDARAKPKRRSPIAFLHCQVGGEWKKCAAFVRAAESTTNNMSKLSSPKPSVTDDEVSVDPADYARAKINASLTAKQKIGFLREMIRIRRFEQTSLKYYNQGMMGGFLHLYIGQEAVAVGTVSLMGKNDHVITAYRDHGHALAVGMGMNE